jgi:signal transduction histidine kinase
MRRRLILGASYLLLTVVVGLAVPFGVSLSGRLTGELGSRVEREAFAVAAAVEDQFESGTPVTSTLQPLVERLAAQIGGRVLLTDQAGILVADSLQPAGPTPPSYITRPEIARALAGEANWEVRSSSTLGYDILVSAVPIGSTHGVVGAVRISYPMDEVREAIRRGWGFLAAVAGVEMAVGLALAVWLARWVSRPLKEAAAVAQRISGGDLDARVPVGGPPEVQELARDLNAMTDRLSDLLRANREFAANAAHQLRTPIAALRLSLEEASDGVDPRGEIGHALRETDRLNTIVGSLLELGKERERGPAAVEVAGVVAEVLAGAPTGRVSTAWTGSGSALANRERVRQVLSNLVDNARRHARSVVRVTIAPVGERVVVRVEDDGPGIPEEERVRVFDRFYRGRRPLGQGSGLGLAVARELAAVDGGTVGVSTSEMGGALFEVSYPGAY